MIESWISITQELPPSEEEVLAFVAYPDLKNFSYDVMTYDADTDVWREAHGRRSCKNVTHWRLLSPPADVFSVKTGEPASETRVKRRESDRNKDIVCWLLEGQSIREIAEMYGISISRVRLIIKRVLKKIVPDMNLSTPEMRRIREHLMTKIREEL
jgi:hypothetical protein